MPLISSIFLEPNEESEALLFLHVERFKKNTSLVEMRQMIKGKSPQA